jgi:hypothetical protein
MKCREYVNQLVGEGWQKVSFKNNVLTLKKDNQLKIIDLRFDTSAKMAGSGISSGSPAWNSPNNICANDDAYAFCEIPLLSPSGYLIGYNFGFAIPPSSTINGISVNVERRAPYGTNVINFDASQYLGFWNGSTFTTKGTAKTDTTYWGTTFGITTFGSTSDLWGTTWSLSEVNSSQFGIRLQARNVNGDGTWLAQIDYVEITITYTHTPTEYYKTIEHSMTLSFGITKLTHRIINWSMTLSFGIVKLIKHIINWSLTMILGIVKSISRMLNWNLAMGFASGFFKRSLSAINSFRINYAKINGQGMLQQIVNFIMNMSYVVVHKTYRAINWIISMTFGHIATLVIPKIVNFVMSMSMSIVKLPHKVLSYTMNMSFKRMVTMTRTIAYQIAMSFISLPSFLYKKTINFIMSMSMNISYVVLQILFKTVNFVMSMSFKTTTSARMFYLYWSRIFNPDILGYKIYEATNPYGTWTLKTTTTTFHYIRSLLIAGHLWIKVIPYTSRGELAPVIFKGIKYV